MKCQFCGGEIPDTALFCIHCGQKVTASQPAAPKVQPALDIPEEASQTYTQNVYDTPDSFDSDDEGAETTVLSASDLPAGWRKSMEEAFAQKDAEPDPQPSDNQAAPFMAAAGAADFQPKSEPAPAFQPKNEPAAPASGFGQFQSFDAPKQPSVQDAPFAQPYNQGQGGSFQQGSFNQGGFQPGQTDAYGAKNQSFGAQNQTFGQTGSYPSYNEPYQGPAEKKKSKTGLWIGIAAGAVVLIAAVVLLILQPWKPKMVDIDLNPYASMDFSGKSGSGEFG